MTFTYYGHSCFLINTQGKNILFDPFISNNELAKNIDINTIKPNYILLSHGHEDHVADAYEIAKNNNSVIVSNYEVATWFAKKGIEKYHPMNHGGKWDFDFGTVKYTNAVHSSSMPDGSYGGNPGGFIITSNNYTFYYSGDTALTYDMKIIGEQYKLDFAVLPIGDNFTMDVNDAITASDWIGCNKIIGVHYDTFGFIKINKKEAIDKFAAKNKQLLLLNIGETINYKTN
jgi:L-ascorbate metabolism protein UlaG (beta-lactamase superfamily)